jgi:hypothetical protein
MPCQNNQPASLIYLHICSLSKHLAPKPWMLSYDTTLTIH